MLGYAIAQGQTAQPLLFLMVDSADHIAAKTGLAPTVTLSKNGGAFASPAGAVTEIGSGWYKVAGHATDSGTLGPLILHATATGADPTDVVFRVVAYDPLDATALGLSTLDAAVSSRPDAAGVRTAVGLASANLDSQLAALPTVAEVDSVVDTALSDYGALKPTIVGRTLDISSTGEAEASVSAASLVAIRTEMDTSSTKLLSIEDLLASMMILDKSTTPWSVCLVKIGTGTSIANYLDGTILRRLYLYDPMHVGVTSTSSIVASQRDA